MTETVDFEVGPSEQGQRLDVLVAAHVPSLSRSIAAGLVAEGLITLNGSSVKPARRVVAGDRVQGIVRVRPAIHATPEDIPLQVVYRDQDLAVIDKPAGLVVHPAAGHEGGTLANALVSHFPSAAGVGSSERPGIVHRLDKDTSGLMMVALNPRSHHALQRQLAERTAHRTYLTLATGHFASDAGVIDAPIGRDTKNRLRMAVHGAAARTARTAYRVEEEFKGFTMLRVSLETGRTHQIRVHLTAIGHPIAGDRMYGGPDLYGLGRQFLHATELAFHSPSSGAELRFTSPLPPDLIAVLDQLRGQVDSPRQR